MESAAIMAIVLANGGVITNSLIFHIFFFSVFHLAFGIPYDDRNSRTLRDKMLFKKDDFS